MTKQGRQGRDTVAVILDAALQVFGRGGFANANVDDIAAVAGVAKPTVYNRFKDKRALFLAAMERGTTLANARIMEAIMTFDIRSDDLRSALEELGLALAHCVVTDGGGAMIRLQITEYGLFPELATMNARERHADALAGKLAQLATSGKLAISDPQVAARHLLALVTSEPLALSGYGARPVGEADVQAAVRAGVGTFLAAFSHRGGVTT